MNKTKIDAVAEVANQAIASEDVPIDPKSSDNPARTRRRRDRGRMHVNRHGLLSRDSPRPSPIG